jgi:uncharacterized membrane protein YeaQ/YmgE (transglycosylase-associated protein family)
MSVPELIVYLLVAAVVGLIAERIVGSGAYGIIGSIIVGVVGLWVMLNVLHWQFPGDPVIGGVPIITALLGAILINILLSALLSAGRGRPWRRRLRL